jgi:hypothetical protein
VVKKSVFSQWFALLLLFSALVWWAGVSIKDAAASGKGLDTPVPSNDPAAIEAVKKVSQDMGDAMVAGDIDRLNQIFADDWETVGSDGKVFTKQGLLSDFKSGYHKLEWFENGPIDVQVFGNVAMAQGGTKEKRSDNGKDASGEFLWQDVLQRRAGKWVVWRSAGARVVFADTPNAQLQDPTARFSPSRDFSRILSPAITSWCRLNLDLWMPRCSAMLPWSKPVSRKREFKTEKTLADSLFLRISSRSAQANG